MSSKMTLAALENDVTEKMFAEVVSHLLLKLKQQKLDRVKKTNFKFSRAKNGLRVIMFKLTSSSAKVNVTASIVPVDDIVVIDMSSSERTKREKIPIAKASLTQILEKLVPFCLETFKTQEENAVQK